MAGRSRRRLPTTISNGSCATCGSGTTSADVPLKQDVATRPRARRVRAALRGRTRRPVHRHGRRFIQARPARAPLPRRFGRSSSARSSGVAGRPFPGGPARHRHQELLPVGVQRRGSRGDAQPRPGLPRPLQGRPSSDGTATSLRGSATFSMIGSAGTDAYDLYLDTHISRSPTSRATCSGRTTRVAPVADARAGSVWRPTGARGAGRAVDGPRRSDR